jgi:hypothetical protein
MNPACKQAEANKLVNRVVKCAIRKLLFVTVLAPVRAVGDKGPGWQVSLSSVCSILRSLPLVASRSARNLASLRLSRSLDNSFPLCTGVGVFSLFLFPLLAFSPSMLGTPVCPSDGFGAT